LPDALHIYRALFGFLHGHVLNELQELIENPDETDDLLRLGLHRLPIGQFPLLRSLAPVLASYDGAAELERGLDILLAGLTTTLPPRAMDARAPAEPRGGSADVESTTGTRKLEPLARRQCLAEAKQAGREARIGRPDLTLWEPGVRPDPFPAQPGSGKLRVTYELGKEAR
jgi:hypothetical protein